MLRCLRKKIFALGKLNKKKESKIIICEINKIENSVLLLVKLIYVKIKLIIMRLITSNPLNPSIKFAPFTINRKHSNTKTKEKYSFFIRGIKKGISMFIILIGKK